VYASSVHEQMEIGMLPKNIKNIVATEIIIDETGDLGDQKDILQVLFN